MFSLNKTIVGPEYSNVGSLTGKKCIDTFTFGRSRQWMQIKETPVIKTAILIS